jgi:acetyltransferase-like isoleucine patch superfamily enzyme
MIYPMRSVGKKLIGIVFLVLAFPCAILSGFGRLRPVYVFFAQLLANGPGFPGDYLRRGYYCLTLERFSFENRVGFGSFFTHPGASVAPRAAIGDGCSLGMVRIGERAIVAQGAQIISGARQHKRDASGRLTDHGVFKLVEIGADAWIGAGAIVMASVGERTTVGAGSVIFLNVEPDVSVTGNPATIVFRRPGAQASGQ